MHQGQRRGHLFRQPGVTELRVPPYVPPFSRCRYLDEAIASLRKGIAKVEQPPRAKKGEAPAPPKKASLRGAGVKERILHCGACFAVASTSTA